MLYSKHRFGCKRRKKAVRKTVQLYGNHYFYAALCIAICALQIIMLRVRVPTEGVKTALPELCFCVSAAVAVGTLMHLYPGNSLHPVGDSAVFVYIGRQMTEGKLPYRDLFDHKGPILYLIEYIGCLIPSERFTGIWILEVLNMAVTLLLLQKLCTLFTDRRSASWPALLMTFIACGWEVYEGGNFVEEYALPWISLAMWIFFRFFRTDGYHRRDIFLLGFGFAVVFFLRVNMVACWIALVPLVLFRLIATHRWWELWQCAGLFTAGCLTVTVPILIWAAGNGCLTALWDCYFVFNFAYTGELGSNPGMYLHLTKVFLLKLLPGVIAMVLGLCVRLKDRLLYITAWLFSVGLVLLEMSGRDYPHYLITQLPILVVGLTCFFDFTARKLRPEDADSAVLMLLCLGLLVGSVGYHVITGRVDWPEDAAVLWLRENTQTGDDVLVLGNSAWTYLGSDRCTENRFFYQTPPLDISEKLRNEFAEELEKHPSDVVITSGGFAEGWKAMVLETEGYVYEDLGPFAVYRRTDDTAQ